MKHCLVVGQSRALRHIACKILSELEFYTEEAEESAAALESCRVQMPDAVLIDLSQPGALEFMRAVRRDKGGKQPQIVFSTIENDVLRISEALRAGADEYFMKPFDRASVEEKFAPIRMAA